MFILTKGQEMKTIDIIKEDMLYEMANLSSRWTGIDNVIIWVGMNLEQHALRVKVSNIPNNWSTDNFTIKLADLSVVGKINTSFITNNIMHNIKHWISLNMKALVDYENGVIVDTGDFLDLLKPI